MNEQVVTPKGQREALAPLDTVLSHHLLSSSGFVCLFDWLGGWLVGCLVCIERERVKEEHKVGYIGKWEGAERSWGRGKM